MTEPVSTAINERLELGSSQLKGKKKRNNLFACWPCCGWMCLYKMLRIVASAGQSWLILHQEEKRIFSLSFLFHYVSKYRQIDQILLGTG